MTSQITSRLLKHLFIVLGLLLLIGMTPSLVFAASATSSHPQRSLTITPGATSNYGPAAWATFIGWLGTDGHLNVGTLSGSFSARHADSSIVAPGMTSVLVGSNNDLAVAFPASDGSKALHFAQYSSSNGSVDFGSTVTIGGQVQTTAYTPALEGSGYLYLAWVGTDAAHHINIAVSYDNGHSWANKTTLTDSSVGGVSLTSFNGQIYVGFTGTDDHIHIGYYTGSTTLAGGHCFCSETSLSTSVGIGLGTYTSGSYGELYVAWTGTNDHINYETTTNGTSFNAKVTLSATSYVAPAVSYDGFGTVYVEWTGTNKAINYTNVGL